MASDVKQAFLERTKQVWNPHKTQDWIDSGVDIVIDKREGYCFWDIDGQRLINMHLNGGVYNLGHRNPEVIQAVTDAMQHFDIGNHHFPSLMRTELAEKLLATAPDNMHYVIFGSGGAEAIDIALKSARNATAKKKIVSLENAYHGHTGLSVKTGAPRFNEIFLTEPEPDQFVHVPFNDLDAMEHVLKGRDVACVIIESIPATYGFPMPNPGYLQAVKALCEKYDALYIADEVQTGLMRTGDMWCCTGYGVTPDIIVTGKGLSGGIYPISAVMVSKQAGQWLNQDGWAHMSTFGGAEIGCAAAMKTLEICQRPSTLENIQLISEFFDSALKEVQAKHPDFFTGIRKNGLVMGLEFNHPNGRGAELVMQELYKLGVWAIYSALDPRVLQFKAGLLMPLALAEEVIQILDQAISNITQSN